MDKRVPTQGHDLDTYQKLPQLYKSNGDGSYSLGVAITNTEPVYVNVGAQVEVNNDTGNPLPVQAPQRQCLGHESLVVTTTASSLTVPTNAQAALLQCDGEDLMVTLDNTTPTSTLGYKLQDTQTLYVDTQLALVKVVAKSTASRLQVIYYSLP